MQETQTQTYTIDATDRSLGRVASEAAQLLMGKHELVFSRHTVADVRVTITNASQLKLSRKKKGQKEYVRSTGYPGGLRTETLREVITKKGYGEVVRRAVRGMLPNNKLRPEMLKHLTVTE